eukprot:g4325.t1
MNDGTNNKDMVVVEGGDAIHVSKNKSNGNKNNKKKKRKQSDREVAVEDEAKATTEESLLSTLSIPNANVARILKEALPPGVSVSKDARQAFSRAAGIFILYLSSTANDYCKINKHQTITVRNVMDAVEEIGFNDFSETLRKCLESIKENQREKKEAKRRKTDTSKTTSETTTIGMTPQITGLDIGNGESKGSVAIQDDALPPESIPVAGV